MKLPITLISAVESALRELTLFQDEYVERSTPHLVAGDALDSLYAFLDVIAGPPVQAGAGLTEG